MTRRAPYPDAAGRHPFDLGTFVKPRRPGFGPVFTAIQAACLFAVIAYVLGAIALQVAR